MLKSSAFHRQRCAYENVVHYETDCKLQYGRVLTYLLCIIYICVANVTLLTCVFSNCVFSVKMPICSVLVCLIYVILNAAGSKLKRPRGVSIASMFLHLYVYYLGYIGYRLIQSPGAIVSERFTDRWSLTTLLSLNQTPDWHLGHINCVVHCHWLLSVNVHWQKLSSLVSEKLIGCIRSSSSSCSFIGGCQTQPTHVLTRVRGTTRHNQICIVHELENSVTVIDRSSIGCRDVKREPENR